MKALKFFWPKIVEIYAQAFSVLKKDPTILFLFFVIGIFDAIALVILYFAPSSIILAPVIRTLWGERFIHYPQNFVLLPKLFNYAHFLILSFFGIFVTGLAIKKIQAASGGKRLPLVEAVRT